MDLNLLSRLIRFHSPFSPTVPVWTEGNIIEQNIAVEFSGTTRTTFLPPYNLRISL